MAFKSCLLCTLICTYLGNQKKFPSAITEQKILNWNLLLDWQA